MSISSEISRLTQAKADIKTAIENKGVTVPSSAKLDDYPELIDDIEQGSTPNLQSKSVSITENGTTTVEPDPGYDGLSEVGVSVNVQGGGGGGEVAKENDVNFIDYDGTILHSYTAEEFLALTEMPENPTHEGLTSQGWNWTLADAKTQVTEMGTCDIGQMYITDDGKTRIYIELHNGRLSPYLGLCTNGTVDIDWGDGTENDTLAGTSLTATISIQHSYEMEGEYIITINPVRGEIAFIGASQGTRVLRKTNSDTANISKVYSACIKKIQLGKSITGIGDYAFSSCPSLTTITIPNSITLFGQYSFVSCSSLVHITIPNGVTSIGISTFNNCRYLSNIALPKSIITIGNSVFNGCGKLARVIIPFGVTSIGDNVFQMCYSITHITIPSGVTSIGKYFLYYCAALTNITIPSGVTSIGERAFESCSSITTLTMPISLTSIGANTFSSCTALTNITIPSGVTSIGSYTFSNCYGMAEYHFSSTTPPTLGGSSVFSNIQSDCKIYVPAESLEAYKSAQYWSNHASKMVGE